MGDRRFQNTGNTEWKRNSSMAATRGIKFATGLLVLLVAATALVEKSDAATYVVGDSMGWSVPSGGAASYVSWAAKYTFRTGDTLVFNFVTGAHDVAKVDKASFDSCSATNPTNLITLGPANMTLTAGQAYYICTFGQHCSLGQKLALNVSGGSSTPSPSPSASPPRATPPPSTTPTPTPAPPTPTPTPSPIPAPPTNPPASTPSPTPTGPVPTPAPSPTPTGMVPTPASSPTPSSSPPTSPPTSPPGASPPSPPSGPTPPPGTEPPPSPPPSSAPATATSTAFLVILVSIAVSILC